MLSESRHSRIHSQCSPAVQALRSDAVLPAVAALGAVEEQRHALLCACREKHCLIVATGLAGHVPGPGKCGICSDVLQDHCLLFRGVCDLIPAP